MHRSTDDPHLSFSGEFRSPEKETAYRQFSWNDLQSVSRRTLHVFAFMILVFLVVDIMSLGHQPALYYLFALRFTATVGLVLAAHHIQRSAGYFPNFPHLLLGVQIGVSVTIWLFAVLRQMPTAYLGVNTILCTLCFYQFLSGRFAFTVGANIFLALGSMTFGFLFLEMLPTELIGSLFFLVPINFLGITILRSINRSKRREYTALIDYERINTEKEKLIHELQTALAEVKTLQGFLPICAQCHKIRDDEGYWESIEKYIQDRTSAQFSHSICPECRVTLYGQFLKNR